MNMREWALPVYTILIQVSTGSLLSMWVILSNAASDTRRKLLEEMAKIPLVIIFSTTVIGVLGAHFHLSKPYLSFLAVLNFRTSWLSREVMFTTFFLIFSGILLILLWFSPGHYKLKYALGWAAIASGLSTVFCMANIYMLPTQPAWNSTAIIASYFVATLLLGVISYASIIVMDYRSSQVRIGDTVNSEKRAQVVKKAIKVLTFAVVACSALAIALSIFQFTNLYSSNKLAAQTSLDLLLEIYQPLIIMRVSVLIAGIGVLVVGASALLRGRSTINEFITPVVISCMLVMTGEILERFLFYATHVRIGI